MHLANSGRSTSKAFGSYVNQQCCTGANLHVCNHVYLTDNHARMIGRRYLTPLVPKSLILFVRLDFLMVGGPRLGSIGDLTTFSHHFFAHLTPELTAADRDGRVPAEISRSQHKPSQRLCHKQLLSALFADVEGNIRAPCPASITAAISPKIYWRCGYNREYKSPEIYPIARIAPTACSIWKSTCRECIF